MRRTGTRRTRTRTRRKSAASMKVLYINNDGGGFADYVDVDAGTTISAFFESQMDGGDVSGYRISVNRQPVASDYVLQSEDRVTITPTNVEGAR